MTASATLEMPSETTTRNRPATAPLGCDRILLTGFMGSGKTTVGGELAKCLGWAFHDLDSEIELRDGRSVPRIFAESGEAHFRRLESTALASLLGQRKIVLALGGGAPEELGNRLLIEQTPRTEVVYLSAPLPTLVERCNRQAKTGESALRPLLGEAEERFRTRHPIYERIAGHRIGTSTLTVDEVVAAVLKTLA